MTTVYSALAALLGELLDGPSPEAAFMLNSGDRGLLGSLSQLSAADASATAVPGNAPVAAHVLFRTADGISVPMELDWLQSGPQSWDILAETDAGSMVLSHGGAKLTIDGKVVHEEPETEYPMLYRRFAEIIRAGASDVDLAPLQHVADAFMLGRRDVVEAFYD